MSHLKMSIKKVLLELANDDEFMKRLSKACMDRAVGVDSPYHEYETTRMQPIRPAEGDAPKQETQAANSASESRDQDSD